MIKLEKGEAPPELTEEFKSLKTSEFKSKGTNVWNITWLKDALLKSSSGYCAYCECSLGNESNYVEVEHFEDKANNSDKVLEWSNLLPSCKRCNVSKGTHDVIRSPILNPYFTDPSEHLIFNLYRFKGKSQLGVDTVDVLNLNDVERVVKARFEVGEGLRELIAQATDRLELYNEDQSTRRKNKLVTLVRRILELSNASESYSATCSTILHSSEEFLKIVKETTELGLWSTEMEQLFEDSKKLALEIKQS